MLTLIVAWLFAHKIVDNGIFLWVSMICDVLIVYHITQAFSR